MLRFRFWFVAIFLSMYPLLARAAYPVQWGKGFQTAASPTAERIHELHHLLLIIITAIAVLVFLLLLYVVFRFNARRHPVPSKTTHNTPLEIVWTLNSNPDYRSYCLPFPKSPVFYGQNQRGGTNT